MKKLVSVLKVGSGMALFALLYGVTLPFRPLFAPDEYDFAVRMSGFVPEMTGIVLPKLPALAATMLIAGLILLAAHRMRLVRPWLVSVVYLVLPPVWFYGTGAAVEQLFALAVTLVAVMLYLGRKSRHTFPKAALCLAAIPAAAAAAVLLKWEHFKLPSVLMAMIPMLALFAGAYLERLDDQGRAGKLLNRIAFLLAFCSLAALTLLILPPLSRYFKFHYPAALTLPLSGGVLRPALAFLVPLLWYFLAKNAERAAHKTIYLAVGIGFMMLTLPAVLPWQRMLRDMPGEAVGRLAPELRRGSPCFFADDQYAGALAYRLQVPVVRFGRKAGEMRPADLRGAVAEARKRGDVVVALSDREFDSYLPPESEGIIYTSGSKRRIIRYFGEGK